MGAFWDFFYIFGWPLAILALLFSLFASFWTKHTFKKFSQVRMSGNLTGRDVAEKILATNQLSGRYGAGYSVKVEPIAGNLTDHYSPKEKVLRLSEGVYNNQSVAAAGVAAHECGHALQDSDGYLPNKIRSALVPVANIGSKVGPYVAIIGVMITSRMPRAGIGNIIFNIGILAFFAAVVFYLVTLPVEINASRRAIAILRDERILTEEELTGAKKVLSAAAMTYIAATASSIITLLRLLSMGRRRR